MNAGIGAHQSQLTIYELYRATHELQAAHKFLSSQVRFPNFLFFTNTLHDDQPLSIKFQDGSERRVLALLNDTFSPDVEPFHLSHHAI
jgi:hypothetical protein